jgi:hypothetical protein
MTQELQVYCSKQKILILMFVSKEHYSSITQHPISMVGGILKLAVNNSASNTNVSVSDVVLGLAATQITAYQTSV